MRLLSRPEVSSQANQQRKEQVDSGIYMAGRVDKLRTTLLELESQQADFIRNNQRIIGESLAEGISRKAQMKVEILLLEVRLEELRKPLDAEWKEIEEQRSELDSMMASEVKKCFISDEKETRLDNLISDAMKEREGAVSERKKVEEERLVSEMLLEAIKVTHSERERALSNARDAITTRTRDLENERVRLEYDRKHYRDFQKELKRKENDLNLRETRLGIKERKYANRQEQQDSGDGIRPGNG